MKILYVEDELAHFELTQRTLEDAFQEQFVLYHVDSIQGALKVLEMDMGIDLVLTDLRLPDGSGLELLEKVKQFQPSPAVVLVTGQGDQKVAVAALKAGAADYLVKEGDYLHRLPAALSNAVAQVRLTREQSALRAAENRFRVLVEQLPAAVYTNNDDEYSSVIYISPQIEVISGYTAAEWIADKDFWYVHLHPDDLDAVKREVLTTQASQTEFNMEYRFIHRNGSIVWIRDYGKLIFDEKGKPKYWQGIMFDMTKSVEAQATIKASEERFKRIFHSTPIATAVVTVKDGTFIDANQAFEGLMGIPLQDLVGHTAVETGFWENKQRRDQFIDDLRKRDHGNGIETRFSNVPNGPRDTLAFYELIELGGESCLLSMFHDITEILKTQRALQTERDFALQVLNNMGQGLTIVNKQGRFEYVNPAYAGMVGYEVNDLMGKAPEDVTASASLEIMRNEEIQRQHGITSTYEVNLIHKDGHEVPVTITGVPQKQNGKSTGAIAVITDLTSQKQNELALERQVKELTALHAMAKAESETSSEDELIRKITLSIHQIYPEVCGILLLNLSGTILTPHKSYMGADVSDWQQGYSITEGITGKAVSNGSIIRCGDITKEPNYIEIATQTRSELCVPIRVHERIIGVINVESKQFDAYTAHDENFLLTVSNGLGNALERIRLYDAEQQRSRELGILYQANQSLTESLEPVMIAERLVAVLNDLFGYESASIHILNEAKQTLSILAVNRGSQDTYTYLVDIDELIANERPLGQGIIDWVIRHGLSARIGNVSEDERYFEVVKDVKSELCVPLISRGRVIGAINVESIQANAYSEVDEKLITALANSAAIALENARLFEMESKRREEAETLRQAASLISSTLNLDEVVSEILDTLKQVIFYDSGTVFFHEGDYLRIAMAKGYPHANQLIDLTFPADDELFQILRATLRPIIINDVRTDPRFKNWGETSHIRSWMAVPLISRGKLLGTLSLDSRQPSAFNDAIGETALAFAHQAAAAIYNAQLYDETQRRLRELEIINRISTSLRSVQSVKQMIPILLGEGLLIANTSHGSIWIFDQTSNLLVREISKGSEEDSPVRTLRPGEGIAGYVFGSGEKYTTPDLKNDLLLHPDKKKFTPPGLSGIYIPIKSGSNSIGVLMVAIEAKRRITEEINLLTILADMTSNAIHRAELFDHNQEQIKRLTTLREIDAAIASSTDLRVTLSILMNHTLAHLKADAIDIMLYYPELQSLTYLASSGFRNPDPSRPLRKLGEGLAGQVAMKGEIEYTADLNYTDELKLDPFLISEKFITYFGVPLIVKGHVKGVFEIYFRSPFTPNPDWMRFLQTLAGQAAIAIDNAQLFDHLQRSNEEIRQAYDTTLEGWARALELRDSETEGHTRRVTELTMQLADFMGINGEELVNMYRGVLLHDIGKMGVPDQILRKTGPLSENEWSEMRKHPEYAFQLLSPIPYLRPSLDIPYCHHEHWDGSGYPRGLKGEQIPLSARIFSIVDIWDALLSDRIYRKAWPREKVIKYLKEISGTILDPRVVAFFLKMIGVDN